MSSSPPEAGRLELGLSGPRAVLRLAPAPAGALRRRVSSGYAGVLVVADVLALALAMGVAVLVTGATQGGDAPALMASAALVAPATFGAYGLYDRGRHALAPTGFEELGRIFHALLAAALVLLVAAQALHSALGWAAIPPAQAALFAAAALVTVPAARAGARCWAPAAAPSRRVLIVGDGPAARLVARKLTLHGGRTTRVVGFVGDPRSGERVLGRTDELARLVDELEVDGVLLAPGGVSGDALLDQVRRIRRPGVEISLVPELFPLFSAHATIEDVGGMPLLRLPAVRLARGPRMFKRAVDIVVSSVGLLAVAPVLAVVAVVIKLDSPGPVLFRQVRHGRGGREFRICKFRTMVDGAEAQRESLAHLNDLEDGGPLFKIREDPRVTRVGLVLRKLSIDELPQLWNVLRGEMSLVGPRPFVVHESERITGWGERRLETTPGITGLWQILGRNDISFEEMLQLDYLYVTNWSPWWDLKILCRTIPAVLGGRGAY